MSIGKLQKYEVKTSRKVVNLNSQLMIVTVVNINFCFNKLVIVDRYFTNTPRDSQGGLLRSRRVAYNFEDGQILPCPRNVWL